MGLLNNIKNIFSGSNTEEAGIGVNLLTREQKIGLLGISCYLCSPVFIREDKAGDYCMILYAFIQLLGLKGDDLIEVGKKQSKSDIDQYVAYIRTIQKEKSLVLFNATCQQLIELSDTPHFISIAYKRILMDIGYSSEESNDILEGTYFNNRDIEAYKPNHDSSSVSDLDLIIEYLGKEGKESEKDTNEATPSISEEVETFVDNEDPEVEDNNPEYYVPTFLHNWDFTDFLDRRDYGMQIKETADCNTGDLERCLVLEDQSEKLIYLLLYPNIDSLSISEIMEKKFDLYVGITEHGNFWLHDKSKIHYMTEIY